VGRGSLNLNLYLSFSPSKCVCLPHRQQKYVIPVYVGWVSFSFPRRILLLQVWRSWGLEMGHEHMRRQRELNVARWDSRSPILRLSLSLRGDSFSQGEFQWEGKGNGNGNGSGNVPISHFIKHKHTLTNTRPVFLPLLRFSQSPFLCRRAADFCNGQILIFMHFGGKRIKWTIDRVA